MITRPLIAATLAVLSMLAACGGGQTEEDIAGARSSVASVEGGRVAAPAIGGIGGSGALPDSGVATPAIGGIGGTGSVPDSVSGVAVPAIGGIGGSGLTADATASACGLSGVNVTVAGLRLNQSATAGAADAGWVDVALPAPVRVNLMALSNGASLPLDPALLPDGTYTQVRLLLVANDAARQMADSIVTTAGVESALTVPGGLLLASAITVGGGRVSGTWAASAVCQALVSGSAATY